MKIIRTNVESWLQNDKHEHIARCARVCYASEKPTSGQVSLLQQEDLRKSNRKLCETLWNNRHRSMFRHAGVYYTIHEKIQIDRRAYIGSVVKLVGTVYYVSTNEQCAIEYWNKRYAKYRVPISIACIDPIFLKYKMFRVTLCIDTSISITREYNRKSPNNIAEQSTRYVDFIKKVGIRFNKCHWMYTCGFYRTLIYKFMLKTSEWFYKIARSKYGLNLKAEDARFILPLDTMSKVVYTYTIAEWEYIINMRLWDWTGKAHPDAKHLAAYIKQELQNLGFKIERYSKDKQL